MHGDSSLPRLRCDHGVGADGPVVQERHQRRDVRHNSRRHERADHRDQWPVDAREPAAGFTIECTSGTFAGSIQNATTPVEAHITIPGGLTFTGCKLTGVSTAVSQVKSKTQATGRIVTNALTGRTNTSTGARSAHAVFGPAMGSIFTKIAIPRRRMLSRPNQSGAGDGSDGRERPAFGETASQNAIVPFPTLALSGTTIKYGTNPATFVSTENATVFPSEWVKPIHKECTATSVPGARSQKPSARVGLLVVQDAHQYQAVHRAGQIKGGLEDPSRVLGPRGPVRLGSVRGTRVRSTGSPLNQRRARYGLHPEVSRR